MRIVSFLFRFLVLPVALMTCTAVGLTGCEKDEPEDPTYKIGAVFAVTGFNEPLGKPERDTALMVVDAINQAGGINGKPIELIVYDTQSDETECINLAQTLIEEDKVLAIIGPSSSGASMAIKDMANSAGVPLISCGASAAIVDPVAPYVFKMPQTDVLAVEAVFTHMTSGASAITKVALITATGGFGAAGKDVLLGQAPDFNLEIVASETFADDATDMSAQVAAIAATDAQAVVCWGTNPGPAYIAQEMQTIGLDLPLYNSHGIANQAFIDLAGSAANGVIFPAGKLLVWEGLPASDPQRALLQEYVQDWDAAYDYPASTFGGHAYDALMMVIQAIEQAGADRVGIRDALEATTGFVGTGGIFNMSPTDHNGLDISAFVMILIDNGEWTVAD